MQNKYVGDIGDYGKYALLRHLARTGLSLGVNWYLTPDEIRGGDGCLTAYLDSGHMKDHDSELFSKLYDLVKGQRRTIREVESSGILPPDTAYYTQPLDWSLAAAGVSRSAFRNAWHQAALHAMQNSGLVFLDPDNGLQVKSVPLTRRKGNKYIGLSELMDYVRTGKSIVFYNHLERKQEDAYLNKFRALRGIEAFHHTEIYGIKFSGGTVRDYIFLLQPNHRQVIMDQCHALLNSRWHSHFSQLAI